jgi:hypothetical protein
MVGRLLHKPHKAGGSTFRLGWPTTVRRRLEYPDRKNETGDTLTLMDHHKLLLSCSYESYQYAVIPQVKEAMWQIT